jgi:hypothetical protein
MRQVCTAIVLLATTLAFGPASAIGRSAVTSLRTLAAAPERYANKPVTVTGQFRGRAAFDGGPADLRPPNRSRWDFLLNEDDAAVWVSGIRPAGWDFELDPRSAADARRAPWLEVTGTLRVSSPAARRCDPLVACQDVWIQATDLRAAQAPQAGPFELPIRPTAQAPTVVFNDPVDDEIDVASSTTIRLQFSRAMMAETFSERIRIGYGSAPGVNARPIPHFSAMYSDATRSLTITFAAPLAPHQGVRVDLLEGIVGVSGRPFEPWGFRFTTGS